jgi:hypothetical protein
MPSTILADGFGRGACFSKAAARFEPSSIFHVFWGFCNDQFRNLRRFVETGR